MVATSISFSLNDEDLETLMDLQEKLGATDISTSRFAKRMLLATFGIEWTTEQREKSGEDAALEEARARMRRVAIGCAADDVARAEVYESAYNEAFERLSQRKRSPARSAAPPTVDDEESGMAGLGALFG